MELLFGVQIDPNTTTTITLDNINLKTKVEELKRETAEKCNLSKDSLGKVTLHYLKIAALCCNFILIPYLSNSA